MLAKYGVAVPFEIPARSLAEVRPAAEKIAAGGSAKIVVKSQIHAGGRGKGIFKDGFQGGVKVASSVDEAVGFAGKMLGNVLVTRQTGAQGRQVQTLLLAAGAKIKRELYLAVLLDRSNSRPLVMASTLRRSPKNRRGRFSRNGLIRRSASCRFRRGRLPPRSG